MIHIIEGVPGSGKSYYAVNYLISNFFEYDNFYDEYKEKENKNVLVITNIEDLKVKHLNLDVLLERFGLENFFTIENFERIQKQYKVKNIVLIVDECQRYFDRKFYNKDVFYFFQYHRHLGIDIFLITQSKSTISKEIVVLAEYIVRAVPRSLQLTTFKYKFYDVNGNLLFTRVLKKDKNVFRAYKSMNVEEITKPKNVILPKVIFAVASFIFVVVFVPIVLKFFWGSSVKTEASDNKKDTKQVKSVHIEKKYKPFNQSFLNNSSPKLAFKPKILKVKSYGRKFNNSVCLGDVCYLISDDVLRYYSSLVPDHDDDNKDKNNNARQLAGKGRLSADK